jgi:hypothetical protein
MDDLDIFKIQYEENCETIHEIYGSAPKIELERSRTEPTDAEQASWDALRATGTRITA